MMSVQCPSSVFFTWPQKYTKSMGGPQFFQNKYQLFSILACHGHTAQRLGQLFSENVTPLSVRAYFFPKMSFSVTPLRVRAWARMPLVYIILYYTILYNTVLYCIMVYYTIL